MPTAGGWSFALDPELPAAAAPALWRPQSCGHVTIAEPSADGFAAERLAALVGCADVAAELMLHRDWHLVLIAGGRRYRVWIRRCLANEPIAYASPADAFAALRLALTAALHRQFVEADAVRIGPVAALGATERWRLVQWLRLLDAMREGAPARDIAATLILEDVRAYSASEWDGSSERRRIARWQRAALGMRDGGFRTLLGSV